MANSIPIDIKWGIIGCGDVTEVKSGPAFNKVPGSKLVAVMRRNAAKAKDYAERHGVPKWYDDGYQLINDPEVDAVYVATPPASHEEYAVAAMRAGKPVYVEKPMSTQVEDCIRMRDVAASTGVKLTVAHYRRAVPMFMKVKQLIDEHEVGAIRTILLRTLQPATRNLQPDSYWRVDPQLGGPGGLFYDLAPHQLDLMVHYFGPVEEVYGMSANQAGLYRSRDIVSGMVRFSNNIIFSGTWCFTVAEELKEDKCEIIGSQGKIEFPIFGNRITVQKGTEIQELVFEHPQHIQQPMIEQIVRYFSGNGPNPCSADQAIESMMLMEKFVSGK
ncbi:MAG TPA: Gfo/Idh/MocA family oxidoreductase [Chitinophagaceae bacterium]|nr:Gfo/Idh/MocA family oxidoreductase [Chitinophagaceae bacterium]